MDKLIVIGRMDPALNSPLTFSHDEASHFSWEHSQTNGDDPFFRVESSIMSASFGFEEFSKGIGISFES